MPLKYPTYHFSNNKNSKPPGPYCIRLVHPRFIARTTLFNNAIKIEILESLDDYDISREIVNEMEEWLKEQHRQGFIRF